MAPEHLCSAFTEAIQALEIQIRERLIVLKQFDRYVVSNLGMLLDEANRILVQAGVIPNFRYHGTSGSQHSTPERQATPENADNTSSSGDNLSHGGAGSSNAVFEQIHQLLARQRANAGAPSRQYSPD